MGCKHNWQLTHSNDTYPFRCTKCGKRSTGVKKHSSQGNKRIVIVSVIVICALIGGYFIFQTYGTPQNIQNEARQVFNNTGSTIQRLSSQSQQSFSNLQNSVTLTTNNDNRVPIAVYDNCKSVIRTDFTNTNMNTIDTTCGVYGEKRFKFNVPDVLQQALHGSAMGFVNTKVYQYDDNDFKIGLFDQVGEKNYTVSLWQLP